MNKNKIIFFLTGLFMLVATLLLSITETGTGYARYHQHLEQPSEADLGPCPRCTAGEPTLLCTHLPIVMIETNGQTIPGASILDSTGHIIGNETTADGDDTILVSISTVDSEGQWHHPTDETALTSARAVFHIRGNTSRAFDKHGYHIRFVEKTDSTLKKERSFLGMEADSEWVLHGPYLDKTLIRNYMWMNIAGEMMLYTPDVRFCELMLNGEYQGVYVLTESIDVSDARVHISHYDQGSPITSYIVRLDRLTHIDEDKRLYDFDYYTYHLEDERCMEIVYPHRTQLTDQLRNYIYEDISEIERVLYASDLSQTSRYGDYLDLDSFANYFILQEFLAISDTFSASTYLYKDVRGKLSAGPVWDFNNALDNFFSELPADEFVLTSHGWFVPLLRSDDFVERVIGRYRLLRQGLLSDEHLLRYIEETHAYLGSAIDRNFDVWGYSFDSNQLSIGQYRLPEDRLKRTPENIRAMNPTSFEEATQWMIDYMLAHGHFMDNHIDALRQYCADSKNAASELE